MDNLNSIKYITKELRKDSNTLKNRLQSIIYDYHFTRNIWDLYNLPLIPNERCGLWYLPEEEYNTTSYFKSTDGHTNEWKFLFRRLNLHLLPIIEENFGVIIVDSTRKGKIMPDALTKTIPIWCAVLNYIKFEGEVIDSDMEVLLEDHWVKVPSIIPESEKFEIIKKIPGFVDEVKRLNLFTKESLGFSKPLIPYWVYPGKTTIPEHTNHHQIICLTTSSSKLSTVTLRDDDEIVTWPYIQGAADDHELWVTPDICDGKLDAKMFWKFLPSVIDNTFISISNEQLISQLNNLYETNKTTQISKIELIPIKNTGIYFGMIESDMKFNLDVDIDNLVLLSTKTISDIPKPISLHHYKIELNKKGSKQLREIIPKLIPLLNTKTAILCDTGKDLSVAIVLILLCQNFTIEMQPIENQKPNKDLIKQFLNEINHIKPVNPSRNTLQSVNSYLM